MIPPDLQQSEIGQALGVVEDGLDEVPSVVYYIMSY